MLYMRCCFISTIGSTCCSCFVATWTCQMMETVLAKRTGSANRRKDHVCRRGHAAVDCLWHPPVRGELRKAPLPNACPSGLFTKLTVSRNLNSLLIFQSESFLKALAMDIPNRHPRVEATKAKARVRKKILKQRQAHRRMQSKRGNAGFRGLPKT